MNLFLYIPCHSAHTLVLLKSLAYGLISTYKRQNSSDSDFQLNVKRLFGRLLAKGYEYKTLVTLFTEVASQLDQLPFNKKGKTKSADSILSRTNSPLFFHLPYHPKGVSRSFIQQAYKNTCEKPDTLGESFMEMKTTSGGTMRVPKLTVAYSRAKTYAMYSHRPPWKNSMIVRFKIFSRITNLGNENHRWDAWILKGVTTILPLFKSLNLSSDFLRTYHNNGPYSRAGFNTSDNGRRHIFRLQSHFFKIKI